VPPVWSHANNSAYRSIVRLRPQPRSRLVRFVNTSLDQSWVATATTASAPFGRLGSRLMNASRGTGIAWKRDPDHRAWLRLVPHPGRTRGWDITLRASRQPQRSRTGRRIAIAYLQADRIWINRPCDLKTFRHAEVEPALRILVTGAPDTHNPEVTGSNPVPATTKALVRLPFDAMTRGSRTFLAAIWQQTSEAKDPALAQYAGASRAD
jgi:hypothetical protein